MKNIYTKIISLNKENYLAGKKLKTMLSLFRNFKFQNFYLFDIINCGAPRSGSTVLNILINKIILLKISNSDSYCNNETDYISKLQMTDRLHLSKTHVYSHLIAQRIIDKQSIGFFTHRDIRDVIVSYLQKGWIKNVDEFINGSKIKYYTFDAILYAKTKNMTIISYEDLIHNRKDIIKLIALKLDVTLSSNELNEIYRKSSVDYVANMMNKLTYSKGNIKKHNPSTGLHEDHINDPSIGKWKTYLTDEEIKRINNSAIEYLNYFQYPI